MTSEINWESVGKDNTYYFRYEEGLHVFYLTPGPQFGRDDNGSFAPPIEPQDGKFYPSKTHWTMRIVEKETGDELHNFPFFNFNWERSLSTTDAKKMATKVVLDTRKNKWGIGS